MRKSESKITIHFLERITERFTKSDLPALEKTVRKAIQKAAPGEKLRYTHPQYGFTVVIRKMGRFGCEVITCWK